MLSPHFKAAAASFILAIGKSRAICQCGVLDGNSVAYSEIMTPWLMQAERRHAAVLQDLEKLTADKQKLEALQFQLLNSYFCCQRKVLNPAIQAFTILATTSTRRRQTQQRRGKQKKRPLFVLVMSSNGGVVNE